MLLRRYVGLVALTTVLTLGLTGPSFSQDAFPVPQGLETAVEFWLDIFTRYRRNQAVIHDADDLSLIYGVVDLSPGENEGVNWRLANEARKRYAQKLHSWSSNPPNFNRLSPAELRIYQKLKKLRYPFQQAAQNVRAQQGLREKFRAGIVRSGRYIDRMRTIFREYRLPPDLTFLPHVESSFNYKAYSKFGAAGVWQFTRSTGRLFLQISYDIDERRDPIMATHAAAKLLSQNYETLGTWPLAVTAYNHGRGGMERAVRQTGTKHLPTIIKRYNGRAFGFASKNFYAEFLAARIAAKNVSKYFGPVQTMQPVNHETFRPPHYVSVNTFVRNTSLTLEEFQEYNPALRAPILRGERRIPRGYPVRVPLGRLKNIQRVYASLPASVKSNEQERIRWYRVGRGDTLGKIARQFRTSVRALARANDIRNHSRIRVGTILNIPGSKGVIVAQKPKPAPIVVARKAEPKRVVPEIASKPKERPSAPATTYRVARGDNLNEIARRFNTTVRELAEANDIKNTSTILPGTQLTIPSAAPIIVAQRSEPEKRPTTPATYRVARGDNLNEIAKRFKTSVREIAAANNIKNTSRILPGTKLTIPGTSPVATARKPEPKPTVPEVTPEPKEQPVSPPTTYRVARGDNLNEIAKRFNTTVGEIAAANNIDDTSTILAGTKLTIPKPTPTIIARANTPENADAEPDEKPDQKESFESESSNDQVDSELEEEPQQNGEEEPEIAEAPVTSVNATSPSNRPEWRALAEVRVTHKSRQRGWTRVEPEETLGHFAEWLETSAKTLRRINRFGRRRNIRLGQKVTLTFRKVTPEEFEQRRLEYHKGLEDDFFENFEITKTIEHAIRKRESLWKLTHNVYEVPFWLVARYNPWLFEKGVNVGDKVIFPVVVPKDKNS